MPPRRADGARKDRGLFRRAISVSQFTNELRSATRSHRGGGRGVIPPRRLACNAGSHSGEVGPRGQNRYDGPSGLPRCFLRRPPAPSSRYSHPLIIIRSAERGVSQRGWGPKAPSPTRLLPLPLHTYSRSIAEPIRGRPYRLLREGRGGVREAAPHVRESDHETDRGLNPVAWRVESGGVGSCGARAAGSRRRPRQIRPADAAPREGSPDKDTR